MTTLLKRIEDQFYYSEKLELTLVKNGEFVKEIIISKDIHPEQALAEIRGYEVEYEVYF